jgi:23S rRNA (cytidine2498-2'-O)-methyltransferase
VWQRDTARPGYRGFEPGITALASEVDAAIREAREGGFSSPKTGELILDCVLVEPDEWWVGYHHARGVSSGWPGGAPNEGPPKEAVVSRAYLKMSEALAWSGLPTTAPDAWVELGAAPGGASQALLDRGLKVTGIDPAEVDERVLAHPNFTQIRKRGADVRRREFRHFRFLAADMNVAPNYTLDTVEAIVTHSSVQMRGLLLTLKLPEWKLADEIPDYLKRISSWGYRWVRARQLAHNRQEICVAAALVPPGRTARHARQTKARKRSRKKV